MLRLIARLVWWNLAAKTLEGLWPKTTVSPASLSMSSDATTRYSKVTEPGALAGCCPSPSATTMAPLTDLDKRQARLEADIALAWAAVKDARMRWAHCPSPENVARQAEAAAEVDKLIDKYALLMIERAAESIVTH